MKTVIITGAGGYVGGQTAIHFCDQSWNVIGIDNQHPPKHLAQSKYFSKFYVGPFDSEDALELIKNSNPDAVIHTAGTSLVGPSKKDPRPYYQNNFVATKTLVEFLMDNSIKTRLVFSSSAATYGEPVLPPCKEEDPPLPLSPYGESKLMTEYMLKAYANAYGLDVTIFRYFNVCGADSQARHGQAPAATHIIARILEALRDGGSITINGRDYPTEDGTCIRDYVHVEDVARAHLLAVEQQINGVYNLGTATGYSNLQILNTALTASGKPDYPVSWGESRPGDPAVLVGSSEKYNKLTGWAPTHNLNSIISSAWKWYTREL